MLEIGITGGYGNFGSHLIKKYKKKYKFNVFKGDLRKKNNIDKWISNSNFKIIIHAAAIVEVKKVILNSKKAFDVNVNGTKNLVNSIKIFKKKVKFIYLSSAQVYNFKKDRISEKYKTNPRSIYGKQKLCAENFLQKEFKNIKDFQLSILRIFSFTSLKQNNLYVVPSIYNKIKNNRNGIFKTEKFFQKRDFLHINDLCCAIEMFIKRNMYGIYNVGSGIGTPIDFIIKYFAKKFSVSILYTKYDTTLKKKNLISNISKIKKNGFIVRHQINDILADFK